MRILLLTLATALIAACTPDAPTAPGGDPNPRPCPVGEPDCGPAGDLP
jgi:hypothetical protein